MLVDNHKSLEERLTCSNKEPWCHFTAMSSSRRVRGGVRFAPEDEAGESVAITLGDPIRYPLSSDNNGDDAIPQVDTPAETDGEADAADTGLHLGGLQILRHVLSTDEATSRPESDADGPLDGPMGIGISPDLDAAVAQATHSGDEGRTGDRHLEAHRGTIGASARRHHNRQAGKPSKAGKSNKQSLALRTWLRIDKNGETSLLQVGHASPSKWYLGRDSR